MYESMKPLEIKTSMVFMVFIKKISNFYFRVIENILVLFYPCFLILFEAGKLV